MQRRKLLAVFFIILTAFAAVQTISPTPTQAAVRACNGLDFNCILNNLVSNLAGAGTIFNPITSDKARYCDTLCGVSGDPDSVDEHRQVGEIPNYQHDVATYSISVTAQTQQQIQLDPGEHIYPLEGQISPDELLSGNVKGMGRSKVSNSPCSGLVKDDMRIYLDSYSYKCAMEELRLALAFDKEAPNYEFVNRAGVNDKLMPLFCGDRKCDDLRREEVLRKALLGYWWSLDVMNTMIARGQRLEDVLRDYSDCPLGQAECNLAHFLNDSGIEVTVDPHLGYIHSKCVRTKTCALDGNNKTDIAFTTYPTGIEGELPVWGIMLSCMMGITADGVDTDALCSLVVGPDYSQGILSDDGLLWQRMRGNGGDKLHPQAYTMQFCGRNCEWGTTGANVTPCKKMGVNFAAQGNLSDYDHVARLKMGHAVTIVEGDSPGERQRIVDHFNYALGLGIKPILRICSSDTCGFSNVNDYITFLGAVGSQIRGEFYAITGPNEPNTEMWLGGEEGIPETYAHPVARYMDALVAAKNDGSGRIPANVLLLSPAFNIHQAGMEREIAAFKTANAPFSQLDGIAANAYILAGMTMSRSVERLEATNIISQTKGNALVLTEAGAFFDQGNRAQLIQDVAQDLALFLPHDNIAAVNMFNMFNTNIGFTYHALTDQEYAIISKACANVPETEDEGADIIPVIYFQSQRDVFYNVPTGPVDDVPGGVYEVTLLDAGKGDTIDRTSICSNGVIQPDGTEICEGPQAVRKGIMGNPGSLKTVSEAAKYTHNIIAPYSLSNCYTSDEYPLQIPSEYSNSPVINGRIADAISPPDLRNRNNYIVRDSVTRNWVQPSPDPTNPAIPIPATGDSTETISRTVLMRFGIHKNTMEGLKTTVQESCGIGFMKSPWVLTKAYQEGDKPFQTYPSTQVSLVCQGGDTVCEEIERPAGPYGGWNGLLNPCNVGEGTSSCNPGVIAAETLPNSVLPTGTQLVSSKIYSLAQAEREERLAKSPWLELASYESGLSGLAKTPSELAGK
ncbi:hypothetical protein C4579_02335 [Candidatus Microgenomates bacterium]|nr:MAG: hypothetical protein C4579_02335 [Candidatus Microgenomates bacterium]